MKVFLGGTCAGRDWRSELIPLLKINYFNPIVDNWTEENKKEENRQKEICDYNLYVITEGMSGVYSIAEVVEDSIKKPNGTIFCIDIRNIKVDEEVMNSINAVKDMVIDNGAYHFDSLNDVANFLNSKISKLRFASKMIIGDLELSKDELFEIPLKTYIRTHQGEGYIVAKLVTGQFVISMSKNKKDGRRVGLDEISAIYDDKNKKWKSVRLKE